MLTPFGKTVRKMRIDLGITLKSMADAMGKTSSYLSAIETGKRAITDSILDEIIGVLAKNPSDAKELKDAAFESKDVLEFNLSGKSEIAKKTTRMFKLNFDNITEADFCQIMSIVDKKRE